MAGETILQVENGIMDLLAPLRVTQPGGYLKTLATYAGEFHEAVEKIVVVPPAVLLAFAEADHDVDTADEWQTWSLIHADSALRSEETARRGGAAGTDVIGTYTMLRATRARLDGRHPSGLADVGPLLWQRDRVLAIHPNWSIYVAQYRARITYQP
jgi:phage gp37-like protein